MFLVAHTLLAGAIDDHVNSTMSPLRNILCFIPLFRAIYFATYVENDASYGFWDGQMMDVSL